MSQGPIKIDGIEIELGDVILLNNIGHKAPEVQQVANNTNWHLNQNIIDFWTTLQKQVIDYSHMEEDYRRMRCKQIAFQLMKQFNYELQYVQQDWLSVSVSDQKTASQIKIGNLYTLVTFCGEIIEPWKWTEVKSYSGWNGNYNYDDIKKVYNFLITDPNNNQIITLKYPAL